MTHRAWVFTLNNPPSDNLDIDDWPCKYLVFQKEVGANGTEHFQGYVEFCKPIRISGVRKLLDRAHWEPRRGTREEARAYCTKEDTRVLGPWEFGEFEKSSQGARTDVEGIKKRVMEGAPLKSIFEENTLEWLKFSRAIEKARLLYQVKRDWEVNVIVLVGGTGVGKTRYVREVAPAAYWKQPSTWWDGYDGESEVILDDFYGWLPFHELLRVLDRYQHKVQFKGGNTEFLARTIYITSNKTPDKWYDSTKCHLPALYRRLTKLYYVDSDGERQPCDSITELIQLASTLDDTGGGPLVTTGYQNPPWSPVL